MKGHGEEGDDIPGSCCERRRRLAPLYERAVAVARLVPLVHGDIARRYRCRVCRAPSAHRLVLVVLERARDLGEAEARCCWPAVTAVEVRRTACGRLVVVVL